MGEVGYLNLKFVNDDINVHNSVYVHVCVYFVYIYKCVMHSKHYMNTYCLCTYTALHYAIFVIYE